MTDETGALEPIIETQEQGEAQAAARKLEAELAATRQILDADQLASLVAPRARLERVFDKHQAYFFTIDGVLNGRKVTGAMLAGECMLVFAISESSAQELANQGLRKTVELLHEEYETRDSRLSVMEQGMQHDAAGRRGKGSEAGRELANNPKLKHMLEHVMKGLPWKW